MSNEKQTNEKESACVCLTCYKIKCKARSAENKFCPEPSGPVDWRGSKINERAD